jgi:hypothetical protein
MIDAEKRKKYIKAVAWFSVLWGIKEFILEPAISRSNNGRKQDTKPITARRKPSQSQAGSGRK